MTTADLTRGELSWSLDTLRYELWMMRGLRDYMDTHDPPTDVFLHNAILESFLLHVRNVYEFLYGGTSTNGKKRMRGDDIRAVHHFPTPADWTPERSPYLEDSIERINKRLAHMTNQRDDPKILLVEQMLGINWEPPKLCDELGTVASKFFYEIGEQP